MPQRHACRAPVGAVWDYGLLVTQTVRRQIAYRIEIENQNQTPSNESNKILAWEANYFFRPTFLNFSWQWLSFQAFSLRIINNISIFFSIESSSLKRTHLWQFHVVWCVCERPVWFVNPMGIACQQMEIQINSSLRSKAVARAIGSNIGNPAHLSKYEPVLYRIFFFFPECPIFHKSNDLIRFLSNSFHFIFSCIILCRLYIWNKNISIALYLICFIYRFSCSI